MPCLLQGRNHHHHRTMNLTDRTDLRPETIALYQQLEAERTRTHPVLKGVMVICLAPTVVITAGLLPLLAGALLVSPLYLPKMLALIAQAWASPNALFLAPAAAMAASSDQAKRRQSRARGWRSCLSPKS